MKLQFHSCCAVMLAMCALVGTDEVRAVEAFSHALPEEGFLVLANGSIIGGIVAREDDYYRVVLPKGKLQVRADQVDFYCRSKEEAYIRRRARKISTASTIEAHLDMARWCVQQGLFASAAAEIKEARRLEPRHRQIPLLVRLLIQAQALALREQEPTVMKDDKFVTSNATVEQSRRSTAEVPAWARTEFIKRVQPMLVNSCATGGCHVPHSNQQLRIDRTALDGVGNPELFQRNLSAVMEMVNLTEPEASPLLVMGIAVHGASGGARFHPLTPHQLEILRAWVTQLALEEPPQQEDDQPRVAQIVIGMSTSAQQDYVSPVQDPEAATDPFDPASFNAIHDSPRTGSAEEAEVTPPFPPAESAQ